MKKHPEASVISILKLASPLSMHNAARVNSDEVKQTEQDVPNPSEKIFLIWLFYFPLVPYICVGELGQHWFG